jgi:NDP-sugar pyrophosphorylase family protein
MKAMILAAGIGSRLLPLTESRPKALIEIQGVPLLEHTIHYLKYHGIHEIVINIHHFASQVIDFIRKKDSFGIRIEFSDESNELLDTGGGLFKARAFFDDQQPFLLTSSDVITDLDLGELCRSHEKNNPLVTLAVKHRESSRVFIFDQDYHLCGWHNNLTNESRIARAVSESKKIAFSTIHIINPALFGLITERGCFSIIDVYLRLAASHTILGFEHDQSAWFECGRVDNLKLLNQSPEIQILYKKYHTLPKLT